MTDPQLLDAIVARDPAALAALYDRHAGSVLALALRILRDRAEAEELLGDVFFQLWSDPARYDASRGAPIAYLLTLARSRALDRLRVLGRRRRAIVPLEGDAAPAPGPDPLDGTLQDEQRGRVQRALGALSTEQRSALELAYFEGLSHSEIADALRQPLGTVKTRIRLGLARLREALRVEYDEGSAA